MVKWLLVVLMFTFCAPLWAQNVITTTGPGPFTISIVEDDSGRTFMRYDGAFVENSGGTITAYLNRFTEIEWIEFNSPGGVLLEVHGPGHVLREMEIPFHVRGGEVCVSACAFLSLYSKEIVLDGLIAFHLPYKPAFGRDDTLYDISQDMVERTLRESRRMFQNDWLVYLYLTIARESDRHNYVVFNDVDELDKFRIDDPSKFMDAPAETVRIVKMTGEDLLEYVSTYEE